MTAADVEAGQRWQHLTAEPDRANVVWTIQSIKEDRVQAGKGNQNVSLGKLLAYWVPAP